MKFRPYALGPFVLAAATMLETGCHRQTQAAYQPPPPPAGSTAKYRPPRTSAATSAANAPPAASFDEAKGNPVYTEVGLATWYGPNYNHRAAADGTIYDENGMTAAHRTLPLGTVVRVTNLHTGEQVLVRITDRGPFAPGRVLDLSKGAAKAVGVYRAGVVKVRLEAFAHPSADPAGKWCVQTGPFKTQQDAIDLKTALIARYRGAKVIQFPGPTGYWVRADPAQHDKAQALAMQDWIGAPDEQSQAYLVRTD